MLYHYTASRPAGGLFLCLTLGVTVSVPSSDLVSLGGGECDGHMHGSSAGLDGRATV